jgi:hypothetical protein
MIILELSYNIFNIGKKKIPFLISRRKINVKIINIDGKKKKMNLNVASIYTELML